MTDSNQLSADVRWHFWIDRGGTFTDIVAKRPDGKVLTRKLLSDNPEHYEDAAVAGIRQLLGLTPTELISPRQVASVKMGTTVATNALLERKGEPTLLVITQGYADALRIAYQNRPRLFERHIQLPEQLYSEVIEAEERLAADGKLIQLLNQQHLHEALQAAYQRDLRSVAIVFMHGYCYHQHEQLAADLARQIGFNQISCSYQVSPLIKLIGRGDTTVVDAYLSPILQRYVQQVAEHMPDVPLYFMQSSGGLTDAQHFQGKDAILSGPAGGIVGMARTATLAGHDKVIGFDMGGTSTDVSHFAGDYERDFESLVAGVRIRAPMMSIHTVAAGGGSVLHFDGERFRVGPDSAGANPGPASYRRGGPLTVTDANLILGKIQPDYFPQVFGTDADQPLDKTCVEQQFADMAQQVGYGVEAVAEGFIAIAVQQMANAIKKISVARGYDATRYTLQCFGGAGAQHACLVAEVLGMETIFVHPLAGVLSAYGMGLADQSVIREQSIELALDEANWQSVTQTLTELRQQAGETLRKQFSGDDDIAFKQSIHIRYAGTDTSLPVPYGDIAQVKSAFEREYQQRFSFLMPDKTMVIAMLSVEAILKAAMPEEPSYDLAQQREVPVKETVSLFSSGQWHRANLYLREQLVPGDMLAGPAIIVEDNATTVVESGWQATLNARNHIQMHRCQSATLFNEVKAQVDPVMLEVFNNLFMNIAEQMGLQLQNTAYSVNIKERLDFSCALFDGEGNLVANAPHVPVHLGSMGESIKTVISQKKDSMQPGDVYVLNDPYHGGTHLPDITVISPVYMGDDKQPRFFVASRGHHADIGGMTPGSIPAFSNHIDQEGVQINNFKLVSVGQFLETALLDLLQSGPYPARNPEQNIADLKAQIAANEKGIQELHKMVQQFGLTVVEAYMQHVQDNAESAVRKVIHQLDDGEYTVYMDNGASIHVAVRVDHQREEATLDFSGTSSQQNNNFNAPSAVCVAAVLYVFRCLVDDDIPLNAGCLKPLKLIIPPGSMLNPEFPAAVVAGNVETSTCITNALFAALGVMASAQPTMNNLTFGDDTHQYYETIAGGSGAGGVFDNNGWLTDGFNGTAAVQTHMTNSRLTDPEILESRFPVQLQAFYIRKNSGGKGRWSGGDGVVRIIRFLQPMTVSILSNGRIHAAFGLLGGEAGRLGINRLIRADGQRETLASGAEVKISAGDTIEIHTPGGGGFGTMK